jgi:hypothetical protein
MTERPDGKWRVYLQKGSENMVHAEDADLEVSFEKALALIEPVAVFD